MRPNGDIAFWWRRSLLQDNLQYRSHGWIAFQQFIERFRDKEPSFEAIRATRVMRIAQGIWRSSLRQNRMKRDMERFQRRSPPVLLSDFGTDAPFVGASRPQPAERGLRIGENALPVARHDRCAPTEVKDPFGDIFAADSALVERPPARVDRVRPARRNPGSKIAVPVKPAIERREADREGLGQIMMGCT